MEPYNYVSSQGLEMSVSVRIDTLEGQKEPVPYSQLHRNPELKHVGSNTSNTFEFYVTVQLYADSKPLTQRMSTSYKAFKHQIQWNEWLTIPCRYCDLPLSSQLAITIWDLGGPLQHVPYGSTTIRLFDDDNILKQGRQKCKVWMGKEADGLSDSTTDSTVDSKNEMDRLEKLFKKHELGEIPRSEWLDNLAFRQTEQMQKADLANKKTPGTHFLYIDFPRFNFPVVFNDFSYDSPYPNLNAPEPNEDTESMFVVYDPEIQQNNPVESKHRRLVRSHRNGVVDRELKPNAKIRDELNEILNYSPVKELGGEEKDLIWKFRYYLRRDKRALTKFVKSVQWTDQAEAKQAVELLPEWTEIDVDDALELLGPHFRNPAVRAYAVDRLRKSGDDELVLYLLQLVQALKFEQVHGKNVDTTSDSSLAKFLITRASENEILGSYFYWYITVECADKEYAALYKKIGLDFQTAMMKTSDGVAKREMLKRQADWVFLLSEFAKDIRNGREDRPRKIEMLKQFLADPKNSLMNFEPMPLPLDPTVQIVGCWPEQANIFKSSLLPLLIHLRTSTDEKYIVIIKAGDDLRQDQLVIQVFILMDKLLQKENLDLKLMPYRILATSAFTGIMQFIPSMGFGDISSKFNNGVLGYLKSTSPDESAEFGIKPEVMDTYIRSCAGYCVMTYLLGIGDRHLDNLLLTPDGHFFHADFGFILGRDPKPFPPLMKLSTEMVDGMGGPTHPNYAQFRQYCFTAYTTLRKSANLILNLFALMVDSEIPDIRFEPDKAVSKVLERFHLEMNDEEAIKYLRVVMDNALSSLFPVLIDRAHDFMQKWKR